MAQWSHKDRTLHTKIVYYGPAFGGKTTNLEALHRITDPDEEQSLVTVATGDDRTLFFDLLPFDLADILGYSLSMKLYTVPGQVRYDTTRQVVLTGADAVVFVADSSVGREEQNRWSLQNLRMNMRAKALDPASVPVLFQFNKQDLPEAATPDEVAGWLGTDADAGVPAVATEGQGVLDTLVTASQAMVEGLVARADERTRREIDEADIARQIESAFLPFRRRLSVDVAPDAEESEEEVAVPIVIEDYEDPLQGAVETSLRLSEKLTAEMHRAARLEIEADALRRLSDTLQDIGASLDRDAIQDATLSVAADVLGAACVSIVSRVDDGGLVQERTCGREAEPLLEFDAGRKLLDRMLAVGQPCVIDSLAGECEDPRAAEHLSGLQAAASVPLASSRALVAYVSEPDGRFSRQDVRFLAILAGHLAVGLEKARLHEALESRRDEHHRDQLPAEEAPAPRHPRPRRRLRPRLDPPPTGPSTLRFRPRGDGKRGAEAGTVLTIQLPITRLDFQGQSIGS